MRKNKIHYLIAVLLSTIYCLLSTSPAFAAPANYIGVDPPLQSVTIEKTDQQKEVIVKVTNQASAHQTFRLSTLNFGSLNDSGGIVFEGTNSSQLIKKYGLADWLKVENPLLEIDAGQTIPVKLTIINDEKLAPGGHYGALVISTTNKESRGSGNVTINQKVSSLIFATKLGGEKYDLKLTTIKSNRSIFNPPTAVKLQFKNTGNVQVVPRGVVSLVIDGKTVSRGVINEQSSMLLPETTRIFDVNLRQLESTDKNLLQKMTLKAEYRYDGYPDFAIKSQTFYTISPLLVVFVSIALLCLVFGLYQMFIRRKSDKKPAKESSKKPKIKNRK